MQRFRYFISGLVFLLFLSSCKRERTFPSWDVEVLTPLVKSSLNIDRLLVDSILQSNPDSSIKLVYSKDLISLNTDTLVSIPDTTISYGYALPFTYTANPGDLLINKTDPFKLSLPGIELNEVIIQSGYLNIEISSAVKGPTQIVYTVPEAKINGNPLGINAEVPGASVTSKGTYKTSIDLSGYKLNLKGPAGNKFNLLNTIMQISISNTSSGQVIITPQDSMIIKLTYADIIPAYARGYFGQKFFAIAPSNGNFNILSMVTSGKLGLEKVDMKLTIENSYGLDARLRIQELSSINTKSGQKISLSHPVIGNDINIGRSSETGIPQQPVIPFVKTFLFNNSNSNLKAMLENLPDKLEYAFDVQINPLGNVSGSNDFIYSGNNIKVNTNLEIPLSILAQQLLLEDTVAIDVGSYKEKNKIQDGKLFLFAQNGFPLDVTMQVYLVDEFNKKKDSLLIQGQNTMSSAKVDANNKVIAKTPVRFEIPISKEKLNLLLNSHNVIVSTRLNTAAQPQLVKIYSYYSIDFKLTADFNYKLEVN